MFINTVLSELTSGTATTETAAAKRAAAESSATETASSAPTAQRRIDAPEAGSVVKRFFSDMVGCVAAMGTAVCFPNGTDARHAIDGTMTVHTH